MGTKSGGQTNSSAAKAGAPSRPSASTSSNAAGKKTYRDTASGKSYDAPKYGGASVKGLTSKDPANVARNRAGAAKYDSKDERIASATKDSNADKAANAQASRDTQARKDRVKDFEEKAASKKTVVEKPRETPKVRMAATKAPEGYRPGIDPEYNYITGTGKTSAPSNTVVPKPTITLDDVQRKSRKTMLGAASLKMAGGGRVRGKK